MFLSWKLTNMKNNNEPNKTGSLNVISPHVRLSNEQVGFYQQRNVDLSHLQPS